MFLALIICTTKVFHNNYLQSKNQEKGKRKVEEAAVLSVTLQMLPDIFKLTLTLP